MLLGENWCWSLLVPKGLSLTTLQKNPYLVAVDHGLLSDQLQSRE